MENMNLLDLDNDILNIICDYVKNSRSCRAGAGLRLTQRSFYIIISLPASPEN